MKLDLVEAKFEAVQAEADSVVGALGGMAQQLVYFIGIEFAACLGAVRAA